MSIAMMGAGPGARTLVIAAHADDEMLGAGAWLARWGGWLALAVLTDGVPPDRRHFPAGHSGPGRYRRTRRLEALRVWQRFAPGALVYFGPWHDQHLHLELAAAAAWLAGVGAVVRPELILAPAFEGGHPDHDAANLLATELAAATATPILEYALYTVWRGRLRRQCFPTAPEIGRRLAAAALLQKRRVLAGYVSQRATLSALTSSREALRPLPAHDYGRPARDEACVYERWGWPIRAQAVAASFRAYLGRRRDPCASSS